MLSGYFDESGDLGFDFIHKCPSNFFTAALLLVDGVENNRALANAVRKTIERKLNPRHRRHRIVQELKGYGTSIDVKKYFYRQLTEIPFDLYSVTLDKRLAFEESEMDQHRIYNFVARLVLDAIPFESVQDRVRLIIDKSKTRPQIQEFNSSVIAQLQGKLDPRIPLEIQHLSSAEEYGLQAVDNFSWGIFRKYEYGDSEWFDIFASRIRHDRVYPS